MSATKTIAAIALAAVLPTMAQAANFDLTNGSGNTATATFSAAGIGLDITANSGGASLDVSLNNSGVGVDQGTWDADGIGNNEFLTLTFSQAVTIQSLRLAGWDSTDNAVLSWEGGSINLSGPLLVGTHNEYLSGVTGTVFTLAGNSALTSFTVAGLNVDAAAVPAIPEPSTYALMGLGLVGIAAASRRRGAAK